MKKVALLFMMLTALMFGLMASPSFAATTATGDPCATGLIPAEQCEGVVTTQAGPAHVATTSERSTMNIRAGGRTVYCKWWKQTMAPPGPDLWREMHRGIYCYNHRDVWIHRWTGYHRCGLNEKELLSWSVTVMDCYNTRKSWPAAQGGYFRQNWDRLKTCYPPLQFCKHRDMHMNVFPSGKMVGHGNP